MIAAIAKDVPLEFELARERAMCCGAGGARMWIEDKTGRRMNVLRAEQALGKSPAIIATACPYCAVMMKDGIASLGNEAIVVRDIAELALDALIPTRTAQRATV